MADELINPLVKLVQARLPWLFSDYGFRIVDYSYDPRSFGNSVVTLESESLRIRFIRDRSITWAEIAARANPDVWYDLGSLLDSLHGERPDAAFEGTAVLLEDNWRAIKEALGPRLIETKREQERRRQEAQKTFERLQSQIRLTPRGRINMFKKTALGRVLFLLLRYIEVALILWAIYVVFNHRST
ncbi:MAG: hypothetical protein ACLPWF_02170 [Bryobacteraceae bacterium]